MRETKAFYIVRLRDEMDESHINLTVAFESLVNPVKRETASRDRSHPKIKLSRLVLS
jgi:hypothetical protein